MLSSLGRISSVCGTTRPPWVGRSRRRRRDHHRDVTLLAMQDVKGMNRDGDGEPSDARGHALQRDHRGRARQQLLKLDQVDTMSSWIISGAMAMDALEVWVEVNDKITIKCGSSSFTVTKTEIKIEAANVDLSGAEMDAQTLQITHNRAG
jgi:hypothetical protein